MKKTLSILLTLVICLSVVPIVPLNIKADAALSINGGGLNSARFIIDPGHGGSDPGACSLGRSEAADVLRLSLRVGQLIIASGETVAFTRVADVDVGLGYRSTIANNGNFSYFCSIHRNAGGGTGVETFHQPGEGGDNATMASQIQSRIATMGWANRGVKTMNLSVTRETYIPAVLTEVGFIDSANDNAIFVNRFEDIAVAIANGLLAMVGKQVQTITNKLDGASPVGVGTNYFAELRNVSTGKYLTANASGNAVVEADTASYGQIWKIVDCGDYKYKFVNASNNKCLDVNGAGSDNGTNVKLWDDNGSDAQRYYIYNIGGKYTFRASYIQSSVIDIDVASSNAQIWTYGKGNGNQQFEIKRIDVGGALPVDLGTNFTANIVNFYSGLYLTEASPAITGKAKVGNDTQNWTFVRAGNGSYKITNKSSGKCFDIAGAANAAGTDLRTFESNDTAAQRYFVYNLNGMFYFKPLHTDLIVDMDATTKQAHIYGYGAEDTQKRAQGFDIIASTLMGATPADLGDTFDANIVNALSKLFLTGSGATIKGVEADGTAKQNFTFVKNTDGTYTITNKATKTCIAVKSGARMNGTEIILAAPNGYESQKFFVYSIAGYYYFKPVYTSRVIDMDAKTFVSHIHPYDTTELCTTAQRFDIVRSGLNGKQLADVGTNVKYYIMNANASLYVTAEAKGNVSGSAALFGATVEWTFIKNADGSYTIKNAGQNKVLDVAGGGFAMMTNVQLYESNNTLAQKFFLYKEGDAYFIKTGNSSRVLDIYASTSNLQTYEFNGTNAQKFYLFNVGTIHGQKPIDIGTGFDAMITNSKTGLYASADSKGAVKCVSRTGTKEQTWNFTRNTDGSYTIKNVQYSKVFDVYSAATEHGTDLQIYESNGTNAQKFFIYKIGDYYYFKASYTNLVVDMDAKNFDLNMCALGFTTEEPLNAQRFDIVSTKLDNKYAPANLGNAFEAYVVNQNAGLYLTVDAKDNVAGAAKTGAKNQLWNFTRNTDGTYTIKSSNNSKVMDVSDCSSVNSANVWTYESNGTQAQKYYLYNVNGIIYIKPIYTSKALDIDAPSKNLQVYVYNGTKAQQFVLYDKNMVDLGKKALIPTTITLKSDSTYKLANGSLKAISEKTTLTAVIGQMSNTSGISAVDASGKVLAGTSKVGTGTVVSLTVDGKVTDKVTITVLGDVNGDGVINTTDVMMLKRTLIGQMKLEGVFGEAADADESKKLGAQDYLTLKRYLLGMIKW